MSAMRRLISRGGMANIQRLTSRSAVPAVSQVSNFSSLAKKELGDEAAYIRKQESQREAEIRADLDRILALEDDNVEKQELMEHIEEAKKPETFFTKYGLDDWKMAVPIGLCLGVPVITNEYLIIDAEFQLGCVFFLWCSTVYTQLGPSISKELTSGGDQIYEELKKVDDALLSGITSAIENNEMSLSLEQDFSEIYAVTDEVAKAQAEVANHAEAHKYRDAIVKKLDSLYALEEAASSAIRARMINKVKGDVVSAFQNDKKIKEVAMAAAMAVLASGGGKMGKDVVGAAFSTALKDYKESYAKMPAGSDEILVTLEKDMAAVAVAPVPEGQGGNVYAM